VREYDEISREFPNSPRNQQEGLLEESNSASRAGSMVGRWRRAGLGVASSPSQSRWQCSLYIQSADDL